MTQIIKAMTIAILFESLCAYAITLETNLQQSALQCGLVIQWRSCWFLNDVLTNKDIVYLG
jgi:hypothetical protein